MQKTFRDRRNALNIFEWNICFLLNFRWLNFILNMSKKEKPQLKKTVAAKTQTSRTAVQITLMDKLNNWFEKNDKKIFYCLLFFSTLFSLLLFDSKVSDGGDDSSYIERAWSFLHEGKFPYFQ